MPEIRQQNDLGDLFIRIGELDLQVWYLKKALQAANERIIQLSKQPEEEKKKEKESEVE